MILRAFAFWVLTQATCGNVPCYEICPAPTHDYRCFKMGPVQPPYRMHLPPDKSADYWRGYADGQKDATEKAMEIFYEEHPDRRPKP